MQAIRRIIKKKSSGQSPSAQNASSAPSSEKDPMSPVTSPNQRDATSASSPSRGPLTSFRRKQVSKDTALPNTASAQAYRHGENDHSSSLPQQDVSVPPSFRDSATGSFECATRHLSGDFTASGTQFSLLPSSFANDDTDNEEGFGYGSDAHRSPRKDLAWRKGTYGVAATVTVGSEASKLSDIDFFSPVEPASIREAPIPLLPSSHSKTVRASLPKPPQDARKMASLSEKNDLKQKMSDARQSSATQQESASRTCNIFSPSTHTILPCPFSSLREVKEIDRPTLVACRGDPHALLNAAVAFLTGLGEERCIFDGAMLRRHSSNLKLEALVFVDFCPVHVKLSVFDSPSTGNDGCVPCQIEQGITPSGYGDKALANLKKKDASSQCFWLELCRFSGDCVLFWQFWQDLMAKVISAFRPNPLSKSQGAFDGTSGSGRVLHRNPSDAREAYYSRAATEVLSPSSLHQLPAFDLQAIDSAMASEMNSLDGDADNFDDGAVKFSVSEPPPTPSYIVHLESAWASNREEGASYIAQMSQQRRHREKLTDRRCLAAIKTAMMEADGNAAMLFPLTTAIRHLARSRDVSNIVDMDILEAMIAIVENPVKYCKWSRRGGCGAMGKTDDGGCDVSDLDSRDPSRTRCLDASTTSDCEDTAFPPLVAREAAAAIRDIVRSSAIDDAETFTTLGKRLEKCVTLARNAASQASTTASSTATSPRQLAPESKEVLQGDNGFLSALEEAWIDCVCAGKVERRTAR